MTANEDSRRHAELETWAPYIDAYVDGSLDEKDALRLHLAAEKSSALAEEIRRRRQFFAALDAMPVTQPSPAFDARVLENIPLEKYRSAPRRVAPVLVLGHEMPSPVSKLVHALGRGVASVVAAYLLALAVSSTALQGPLSRWAQGVGNSLREGAADAAQVPVLAELAAFLSNSYDAFSRLAGGLASVVGPHAATFAMGLVLGGVALLGFLLLHRRTDSQRTSGL